MLKQEALWAVKGVKIIKKIKKKIFVRKFNLNKLERRPDTTSSLSIWQKYM